MSINAQLFDKDGRACLTTRQASAYADLSMVYIGRLLRSDALDGFRVDREWYVYCDSLDNFLAQKRKSGPRGPLKKRSKVS